MDKRYQVFVSSTFRDLVEERQQVIQGILGMNWMPAGMEYFPAATEEVWTALKRIIDNSDYYVVIVAGRYGSVDEDGVSFTQKEYEYAVQAGKPVAAFLHGNPDSLPREATETNRRVQKKLEAFRALCKKNTARYGIPHPTCAPLSSKAYSISIKIIPASGGSVAIRFPATRLALSWKSATYMAGQ
jgi:hypothetical protein